jgi:hypothetical protein
MGRFDMGVVCAAFILFFCCARARLIQSLLAYANSYGQLLSALVFAQLSYLAAPISRGDIL